MACVYVDWKKSGAPVSTLAAFHRWIPDLWALKQSPERVLRDGVKKSRRAVLSAFMLRHLLSLAIHCPRHCKLERARALVVEFAPPEGKSVSESLVEKVWAEFKTVAHLWATMEALYGTGDLRKLVQLLRDEDWLRLLIHAEACRRLAESHRLLDSALTWKAPDLNRVAETPVVTPPSDAVIEYLDMLFPD